MGTFNEQFQKPHHHPQGLSSLSSLGGDKTLKSKTLETRNPLVHGKSLESTHSSYTALLQPLKPPFSIAMPFNKMNFPGEMVQITSNKSLLRLTYCILMFEYLQYIPYICIDQGMMVKSFPTKWNPEDRRTFPGKWKQPRQRLHLKSGNKSSYISLVIAVIIQK